MPTKLKEFIDLLGWLGLVIICIIVILGFAFLYQGAIVLFTAIVGASTIAYTIINVRLWRLTRETFALDFLNSFIREYTVANLADARKLAKDKLELIKACKEFLGPDAVELVERIEANWDKLDV